MAKITSYDEIMRRSSTFVDDHTLSLQFPGCEWGGYFLFATLRGDGPCQAVNLGLLLGFMNGQDLRMPHMVGDPRRLVVIRSLICHGVSYRSPDETSYTRSDLIYSRVNLDVQVADVARICGSWPCFEFYFVDKNYDITYDLRGRASCAHWLPDHIYSNVYSYVVFPDFTFHGTISVRGDTHAVEGVGALDHVVGRALASPSSPGVGFWHYDPIGWENGWASNGLYFIGAHGETVVAEGCMTIPDGSYHPCKKFVIEYLEWATGGANSGTAEWTQSVPRAWRGIMEGSHGSLTYEVRAKDVVNPAGVPICEANSLYDAEGVFKSPAGGTISLRGKGYNEYMGGALDPSRFVRP